MRKDLLTNVFGGFLGQSYIVRYVCVSVLIFGGMGDGPGGRTVVGCLTEEKS